MKQDRSQLEALRAQNYNDRFACPACFWSPFLWLFSGCSLYPLQICQFQSCIWQARPVHKKNVQALKFKGKSDPHLHCTPYVLWLRAILQTTLCLKTTLTPANDEAGEWSTANPSPATGTFRQKGTQYWQKSGCMKERKRTKSQKEAAASVLRWFWKGYQDIRWGRVSPALVETTCSPHRKHRKGTTVSLCI